MHGLLHRLIDSFIIQAGSLFKVAAFWLTDRSDDPSVALLGLLADRSGPKGITASSKITLSYA